MDTDTASASGDGRGEPSRWTPDRRPQTGRVFVGLFVIGIGVMLLLDRLGHYDFHLSARLWPFVLILLGAARLADGAWDRTRGWITALWLIYVGGWGVLNEWHVFGFDYDTSWPLLVVGVGLLIVARSLDGPRVRRRDPRREG